MKTQSTDTWRYRRRMTGQKANEETDVGYEALAFAIVKQAILDYLYADQCLRGVRKTSRAISEVKLTNAPERTKYEVVRFFHSKWYGTLCDIDPNKILRRLGEI